MCDLIYELLGPVNVWTAKTEKGKQFLGRDSLNVDPCMQHGMERRAKESFIVVEEFDPWQKPA